MKEDAEAQLRQEAWVGDAVLALFTRRWILAKFGMMDGELMNMISSNQFLSRVGNPTAVEAEIGRIFEAEGLDAAFAWIEQTLIKHMADQVKRHRPHWVSKLASEIRVTD